ncbi:MAG: TldD/PmbA family protein [Promethearchaeota archaeon]
MQEKIDIFSLGNYGLKSAQNKSSDIKAAEIFFGKNKYTNIEVEENSVKNSEIGIDRGVSIRIIDKRGSLGFAFTNKLDKKSIDKIVNLALKMMKAGTEDQDFKDLPNYYKKYPMVTGLFDNNLRNLEIEESIGYIEDLIRVCNDDDLAISQSAEFISHYYKKYIFNSNGLEANGKETICTISSNITVKDKISGESSFGHDWQAERQLMELDATKIAQNALKDAKRNLNRKKIKKMKVPLILTPFGTINLILSPISSAINGETFQYRRCFLVDKRNELIGSKLLNIEDKPLLNGLAGSSIFDGEGVPRKNKKIFENGKFLNDGLFHNSYTAGKEGIECTGNASRGSYSSTPSIGPTNFIMKPGSFSKEEMIKDVKKGIILDYTGDSPNIATGDFSGLILHGNLIINGEIKDPLNETMVGINLLDLFSKIDAVSKEFKTFGAFHAPYVRIEKAQIIGAAH